MPSVDKGKLRFTRQPDGSARMCAEFELSADEVSRLGAQAEDAMTADLAAAMSVNPPAHGHPERFLERAKRHLNDRVADLRGKLRDQWDQAWENLMAGRASLEQAVTATVRATLGMAALNRLQNARGRELDRSLAGGASAVQSAMLNSEKPVWAADDFTSPEVVTGVPM